MQIKRQASALRRNVRHTARAVTHRPLLGAAAAGAAALAALGLVNWQLSRAAERRNPPKGKFITVDGVRLHYVERGTGEPLVLLHGNGSMAEDFLSSGLVAAASKSHRVIVFDRPGYGHSARPRSRLWTPDAQARLIAAALAELGVKRAVVFGHSWGCSVAVALALRSPRLVRSLVLASGFYFPELRLGVIALSGPALPIAGDVIRYTLGPVSARLMWPLLMRKIFGPAPVPQKFKRGFPKDMAVRPSQLRASAEETAMLMPSAAAYAARYGQLRMPVIVLAGTEDQLIDTRRQSVRFEAGLPNATYHPVAGAGHMVHQSALPDVLAAIEEAAAAR